MSKTRLALSVSFKDKNGQTRWANRLGNVWIDLSTGKGSIELHPGVCLVNPGPGNWINVDPPRERDGQQRRGGAHEAAGAPGYDETDDIIF